MRPTRSAPQTAWPRISSTLRVDERAGLVQHGVGHADLADVVQARGVAEVAQLQAPEPDALADPLRQQDHPVRVLAGVAVAQAERARQHVDRRSQQRLVVVRGALRTPESRGHTRDFTARGRPPARWAIPTNQRERSA